MKYAILLKPNSNIPYFEELKRMCIFEAKIIFNRLGIALSDYCVDKIGKGHYFKFAIDREMTEVELKDLTHLSFFYTLFVIEEENLFRAIDITEDTYITEDISTRLKYMGKTNEAFTRLLINASLYSTDYYNNENINLLDPVCGKGTTLYEGLVMGFNAYGVEKNKKSVEELYSYVLRFLKEGRYKHKAMKGKAVINGENLGETIEISIGKSKDEVKKNTGKVLKVMRGDTTDAWKFYKKNSMHLIVGDLPYGVQHMGKDKDAKVRNLDNLLVNSIKSWYKVLKPGGALGLSWNTYTNKREELADILSKHGFDVMDSEAYMGFGHRVSQAINRDIIIGIKK